MLDTNIVSDLVTRPTGPVFDRIAELGSNKVCISILTAAELRYGVHKKASARLTARIERILAAINIVAFDLPADHEYGRIRDALTRAGTPIGPVDFLIAAHALALDLTLVTANTRELSRVPDLRVENWLD